MDRGIKRPNSDSGGGEASNDDEVRFWGSDHQRQAKGAKLGGAASHDRSIHAQVCQSRAASRFPPSVRSTSAER